MTIRWRVAARLARREVRAHWARAILVVAIIAVPVAAAQAVGLASRSSLDYLETDRWAVGASGDDRTAADERIGFDPRLGEPAPPTGAVETAVGFSVQDWVPTPGRGTGPDDLSEVALVGFVPGRTALTPTVGRLPRDRSEVVVATDLAERTGAGVGDDLEAVASQVDLTVVGLVDTGRYERSTAWAGPVVGDEDWVPGALARIRDSGSDLVTAEMFQLVWRSPAGEGAPSPVIPVFEDDAATRTTIGVSDVVVGSIIAATAIGFVATTASSAFAIGARRQMRQLGILAAAGASPSDLLRAVLLQGTTLGLAGGLVGTVIAYAGRALVVRIWLADSGWVVPLAPGLVVGAAALGVVTGTVAAAVPAFTASRVPVLSALAGRRPTRRRPLRSPWAGVVLVTIGLALLTWAAGDRSQDGSWGAIASVVGVFATMVGAICLSPGLVALVGAVSGRIGGTVRLAGRSLARSGMRTAAVVASTAVAFAVPAMVLVADAQRAPEESIGPEQASIDESLARSSLVSFSGPDELTSAAAAEVEDRLAGDALTALTVRIEADGLYGEGRGVDPGRLRAVTGDSAVADALAAGALVRSTLALALADVGFEAAASDDPGTTPPAVTTGRIVTVDLAEVSPATARLIAYADFGLVDATGVDATNGGLGRPSVVVTRRLSAAEQTEVLALATGSAPTVSRAALADLAPSPYSAASLDVYLDETSSGGDLPWPLIVLAASILLALVVVGTSSALAAADGRDDERIVAAVGAPPGVVRRRRVLETALTTAAAIVLGGGVGAVATLLVVHRAGQPDPVAPVVRPPLSVPLVDLTGMAVGSVALIAGVTWLCLATAGLLRGRRDLHLVD